MPEISFIAIPHIEFHVIIYHIPNFDNGGEIWSSILRLC